MTDRFLKQNIRHHFENNIYKLQVNSKLKNDLTLAPGPMTRAYCGPDSLDNQYLSLLSNMTTVSIDNDQLVLGIGEDGDRMLFVKGNVVEQ